MMAAVGLILLTLGGAGLGAMLLTLSGIARHLRPVERLAWSFMLGSGGWGWLLFWIGIAGYLTAPVILTVLALSATGCLLLRRDAGGPWAAPTPSGRLSPLLALLVLAWLVFLWADAMVPPTDADSLAYHFAMAKEFAQAGRIVFVPRAIDGAVPLMYQVGYASAYLLGGETAMTAWATSLSLGTCHLIYVTARRWLDRNWSVTAMLAVATLPASVYGAASGQVELKIAGPVLLCCLAAAAAVERRCWRHAAIAGLAAGIFVASKYTGLLLAAAAGTAMLMPTGRWRLAVVFGLACLGMGAQWYGWNWLFTGDPLFPTLRPWIAPADPYLWPWEFHSWHKRTWNEGEIVLPQTLWSFIRYPFIATFAPPAALDSARVGLGCLPILLLPFALAGVWRHRTSVHKRYWAVVVFVALLFAVLWFFLGATQRTRHFLPVVPPLLLFLMIAAERGTRHFPARKALLAGLAMVLAVQLAGLAVYGQRPLRSLLQHTPRDRIFEQSVSLYGSVRWINANLPATARVVHDMRFLNYLFTLPYYHAHPFHQALVDMSPGGDDPDRFLAQLCRVKATHVLAVGGHAEDGRDFSVLAHRMEILAGRGNARLVTQIADHGIESRTLGGTASAIPMRLYAVGCPAAGAANDSDARRKDRR